MREIKTTETKKAGAVGAAPDQMHNIQNNMHHDNIIMTPDCQETYEIAGRSYPVKGKAKLGNDYIPIVDLPMMSDFKWQLLCLESRLKDPEQYQDIDNGEVLKTICRLISWAEDHKDQATETERLRLLAAEQQFENLLNECY